MVENKILYAITIEDINTVSSETGIKFSDSDFEFLEEKIFEVMGRYWHDAVKFALNELNEKNNS